MHVKAKAYKTPCSTFIELIRRITSGARYIQREVLESVKIAEELLRTGVRHNGGHFEHF